ncbi:MAG: hypothetical protein ACRCTS_10220 [Fusobacteriaceae bacterium]
MLKKTIIKKTHDGGLFNLFTFIGVDFDPNDSRNKISMLIGDIVGFDITISGERYTVLEAIISAHTYLPNDYNLKVVAKKREGI